MEKYCPFTTNNSPKYRGVIIRKCNSFSSTERQNNKSAAVSLQGVIISSKCKKNVNFWLLTLQPCRQKWKNGNSLFLCTPKERHFHKSTTRKDLSTLGIQKRQVVNSFPLLFNPEFQYLSQRIWGILGIIFWG